jgi:CAAX amino terminal protease family.
MNENVSGAFRTVGYVLNMPVHIFAVLIQLFLFLYARYAWGPEISDVFFTYMLMLAFSYALLGVFNPLQFVSLKDGIVQYLAAFVGGLILFVVLGMGKAGSGDFGGFESITGLILAQTLIVALSEELLFRGALPRAIRKALPYGTVPADKVYFLSCAISVCAFAIFHGWAYDWSAVSILAALCFGAIMQFIWDSGKLTRSENRVGGYPLMSVGFHAAWNVVLMSPFTVLLGLF